jgi:hypothetical protein
MSFGAPGGGGEGVDLTQRNKPPTSDEVTKFHQNADTDTRLESIHHTVGPNSTQASPGDHRHRGGDSQLLLGDITLTGSRAGNIALLSVIQALVALGATDNTTA